MSESPKKRPDQVGIKAFQEEAPAEIESPMRIKKRQLGTLNLSATATERPDAEPKFFKRFEAVFSHLMKNFENKKHEFEELKKMDDRQLQYYNKEVKLTDICSDWSKALEMHMPECKEDSHPHDEQLTEFNDSKRGDLR